jgi:hypothetical protein
MKKKLIHIVFSLLVLSLVSSLSPVTARPPRDGMRQSPPNEQVDYRGLKGGTELLQGLLEGSNQKYLEAWNQVLTYWYQQAYLKASNTDEWHRFGSSIAISGDTIVVGAPSEDTGALASGAAYVFVRDGTGWTQQAFLKAYNSDYRDFFGRSVAISGDTIVVGAIGEDSAATGIDGDMHNNDAYESGAAYVYQRSDTSWYQQAYLKASNTGNYDFFGYSVAISGDTILVGAWGEDSAATGVNGDQTDNTAPDSGAAYVFVRDGSSWSQQAYLKASNTDPEDEFGSSVAVSDWRIVVGAPYEDSNSTQPYHGEDNNDARGAGAAYVFGRNNSDWSQQVYLKASNTEAGDFFGYSVDISEDTSTVVVGAPDEDSSDTGVNGNASLNDAEDSGAVYVFEVSFFLWGQQAYLKASNTDPDDHFGDSIAISGNTIVVGAWGEDSNATGIDGDEGNNDLGDAGAAYVFARGDTSWKTASQAAYLKASNTDCGHEFGRDVSVSWNTISIGAPGESTSSTGVNEDEDYDYAASAGVAYVFVSEIRQYLPIILN